MRQSSQDTNSDSDPASACCCGATAARAYQEVWSMAKVKTIRPHGVGLRGANLSRSSILFGGPFGRIFRALPPADFGVDDAHSLAALKVLAGKMTTVADPADPKDGPDNEESGIPSAHTYFGQFIDHDLTFDPASSL